MSAIKLFSDRISHPSRASLLLLKSARIPHEEINIKLFRGENMKRPELPFKKLPVLTNGSLTIAESTSILRYIGQTPGAEVWYGARSLEEKTKIDEFLDNWQSTINPNVMTLVRNNLLYKMVFRKSEPDQKVVKACSKLHTDHKTLIKKYFMGSNQFIGGAQPSIADIMLVCTLQQSGVAGADHSDMKDYISGVREATDTTTYDELDKFIYNLPQSLKEMKML